MLPFKKSTPSQLNFLSLWGGYPAPVSFATQNYHCLHAFKFTNATGKSKDVRWNFISNGGEKFLSKSELAGKDKNYLSSELLNRAASKPAWTMEAVLAENSDSLIDPSKPWPESRKKVGLGLLTISSAQLSSAPG
ncbi:MAG: catalase [Chitinophagaceae bacterium]|nr:catalase [Oligoflexus sp.]